MLFTAVEGQDARGARGGPPEAIAGLVLAYEPVWAFVTGANGQRSSTAHELLSELRRRTPRAIRIVYSGSVNPENAELVTAESEIDGALVGGPSLNVQGFVSTGKKTAQAAVRRN
jgi:triosephosphate isomerase